MYFWLLILGILVFLSAFFSASETSLFSLSRVHVRRMVKQNIPGANSIERLKKDPVRTITTILVGNNIVNISASALATGLAIEYFGEIGIGVATGVMTFLLLTFGEVIPKTLAIRHSEGVARRVAPWLGIIGFILSPIVVAFRALQNLFVKHDPSAPIITEKEIRTMLEISAEENVISHKEHSMIRNMLDFKDTPVKNAMIPMEKLTFISYDATVQRAKELALERGYSRYPVLLKETGRVSGIVHVKQLDKLTKESKGDKPIGNFMQKEGPMLVSEHERLDKVFKKMQKGHVHMAVVVDDKWNHIGIISFEDIIEEIIGEEPEISEKQ